jgi:CubicO group peptidase (beta-lactamase class C family)
VAPFEFTPTIDIAYPPQPADVAWPTDGWESGPLPEGADAALIDATLEEAFGELSQGMNKNFDAVVVVHGGRIVVERYREGFGDETTIHRSWSMAKSITSILMGILVRDGRIDITEPAPVPEWAAPDDPRGAITTEDLLHMASGLRFNENYFAPDSDTIAMLASDDLAGYAASKELEVEPGTRVQYSTGTSNIIGRIVGDLVTPAGIEGAEREAAFRAFIEIELLEPLGIDPATIDPKFDAAGNVNAGSAIDATGRTFAKLGYLYLRGGTWDGHEVVPQSWVDFSRTQLPPPARFGEYGAQWWVEEQDPTIFRMGGFGGQHVVVVTQKDLVVVVLSDRLDGQDGRIRDQLIDAFDNVAPSP